VPPTQDELLCKAIAGDTAALTELLERHGPEIRRHLRIDPAWRPVVAAEDVMQVTYLEAFLQIDRFAPSGKGTFAAWLRRIAENNLRDAVKELERNKRPPERRRIRENPGQDSYVILIEKLGQTSATPSRHARGKEARRYLETAIRQLPEDYQTVVRLYDLDELEVSEVARAMGRSKGAVHMLRARAHDRLRDILGTMSDLI
jgi:RNA polymerase sigma-70 factor (ECF subfamily)